MRRGETAQSDMTDISLSRKAISTPVPYLTVQFEESRVHRFLCLNLSKYIFNISIHICHDFKGEKKTLEQQSCKILPN